MEEMEAREAARKEEQRRIKAAKKLFTELNAGTKKVSARLDRIEKEQAAPLLPRLWRRGGTICARACDTCTRAPAGRRQWST